LDEGAPNEAAIAAAQAALNAGAQPELAAEIAAQSAASVVLSVGGSQEEANLCFEKAKTSQTEKGLWVTSAPRDQWTMTKHSLGIHHKASRAETEECLLDVASEVMNVERDGIFLRDDEGSIGLQVHMKHDLEYAIPVSIIAEKAQYSKQGWKVIKEKLGFDLDDTPEEVAETILSIASESLHTDPSKLEIHQGWVRMRENWDQAVPVNQVADNAHKTSSGWKHLRMRMAMDVEGGADEVHSHLVEVSSEIFGVPTKEVVIKGGWVGMRGQITDHDRGMNLRSEEEGKALLISDVVERAKESTHSRSWKEVKARLGLHHSSSYAEVNDAILSAGLELLGVTDKAQIEIHNPNPNPNPNPIRLR